ncbi:hypothetical protein GCM10010307_30260 [Streptomyces vastus]|uniref:Uncharacterized protein n=1 Tax=Streptomyces vastus TaxID=285451 RepID=A0ABP6D8B2_9ACTN
MHGVVFVDDAGEVRDDEGAAVLDVLLQVPPGGFRHQIQSGHDDKWIGRQVGFGVGEVDGEVAVVEGFVEGVGAFARVAYDRISAEMVRLLLAQIGGEDPAAVILPTELVKRRST